MTRAQFKLTLIGERSVCLLSAEMNRDNLKCSGKACRYSFLSGSAPACNNCK